MSFDAGRVRINVRQAETEDLLDRITVYREGMEPEAVEIVETELRSRGIGIDQIEAHARKRDGVIRHPDGTARTCSFCHRPAIAQKKGWQRIFFDRIPVFPKSFFYCEKHLDPSLIPEVISRKRRRPPG